MKHKIVWGLLFVLVYVLVRLPFILEAQITPLTHHSGRAFDLQSNQLVYTEEYRETLSGGGCAETGSRQFSFACSGGSDSPHLSYTNSRPPHV